MSKRCSPVTYIYVLSTFQQEAPALPLRQVDGVHQVLQCVCARAVGQGARRGGHVAHALTHAQEGPRQTEQLQGWGFEVHVHTRCKYCLLLYWRQAISSLNRGLKSCLADFTTVPCRMFLSHFSPSNSYASYLSHHDRRW